MSLESIKQRWEAATNLVDCADGYREPSPPGTDVVRENRRAWIVALADLCEAQATDIAALLAVAEAARYAVDTDRSGHPGHNALFRLGQASDALEAQE